MSVDSPLYLQQFDDAAGQPGKLVSAMLQRDGEAGGLTLSREHIITLNRYANYVFTLPSELSDLNRWLGYTSIEEPHLTGESLLELFDLLRQHARSWRPLSDASKQLASQLGSSARSIASIGTDIIVECRAIKALGDKQSRWPQIVFDEPVALDGSERMAVRSLAEFFTVLLEDVRNYAERVIEVGRMSQQFRDTASLTLIPAVHDKRRAVQRQQSDGAVEGLRERLKELDDDISSLNKQYDEYVKAALSGLAAGPLGVAITGGIYGSKAESVRKERNRQQAQRHVVAQDLASRLALEGRMEDLATFIDELKSRLDDVVTASSHLHTAWTSVESYISASLDKLEHIQTNHQLAAFIVRFNQFLAQWEQIELQSQQLTRIFDDAAAA
ncbi:alpha-xenorhabdolysin family binary toxin subunit A [Pseudomonas cremoricolorata]|uniref:Binary cytotoxin component n=1 Tax=Pseudomonas cremoricolorata TaxID=157783 RepID=A0A089WL57_9PSED|nr:alpha-xenorhabdolysin family binary toxin subunit A [Pseudomonas cremoricolorata]AIR87874.1 hypothetical protein LK03_00870 [Pseudomonas cremoricolorata]